MATKRITSRLLSLAIPVVLVAGAVLVLAQGTAPADAGLPDPSNMALLGAERRSSAEVVELWERKVDDNPRSASFLASLASAQLTAAGDEGDLAGYEIAERTARRAVAIDPEAARVPLAAALAGQHDFRSAVDVLDDVSADDADSTAATLALGDAQLELGDVTSARSAYDRAAREVGAVPAVRSRFARLESITGDPLEARDLARQALVDAGELDLRAPDAAFYWFQLASYEFALGDLDESERHLRSALLIDPANLGATELLGRVLAGLGRDLEAIDVYERLIDRGPAADLHGELAELYDRVGRERDAAAEIETGLALAHATADEFPAERRHLIGFLADHDPAEALRLARLDLQDRQDVRAHGWYAWSLLQVGRVDEAREAIAPALALGTQDAQLLYHAGSIHAAAGERERAIELLDAALEVNPYFDVDDADAARKLLDDLR